LLVRDVQDGIGHRRDHQGIGDGKHGRAVDDDEVDDLALVGEQLRIASDCRSSVGCSETGRST
jgi:hypothetical protein